MPREAGTFSEHEIAVAYLMLAMPIEPKNPTQLVCKALRERFDVETSARRCRAFHRMSGMRRPCSPSRFWSARWAMGLGSTSCKRSTARGKSARSAHARSRSG